MEHAQGFFTLRPRERRRWGSDEVRLVAIPYALWANRGPSVMRIFVPREGLHACEH
ncbi:hypothetical protein [Diaminobutyricibacter tongyongensis]|uniref:hypothetical protein n=1 Tax=Leifsonia tongyongensis TaxID=1268043 RepID=UPI003B8373E9